MFKDVFLFKYYLIPFFIVSLVAYLIGCINSSILVTKLFKVQKDIRNLGSGNAGFTNVLRTMGKKMAIITFLGDFLKGILAIGLCQWIMSCFFKNIDYKDVSVYSSYLCCLMCVIGHIYPCFFGFKGGKGILTAWSAMLLIDWRVFLTLITVFIIVILISKIVSLASVIAAISYPISVFLFSCLSEYKFSCYFEFLFPTLVALLISIIILIKHRSNILRLLNGTEKRISVHK